MCKTVKKRATHKPKIAKNRKIARAPVTPDVCVVCVLYRPIRGPSREEGREENNNQKLTLPTEREKRQREKDDDSNKDLFCSAE